MGVESEESSEIESEGEDMDGGLGNPGGRRVVECVPVLPGVGSVDEEGNAEIIRLNAMASENFVELFRNKRKREQNERRRQKRRGKLDTSVDTRTS